MGFATALKKMFKYGGTKTEMTFDAKADPKVQIQQVKDAEAKRHAALVETAAQIIGNLNVWDNQIADARSEAAQLEGEVRGGAELVKKAQASGDTAKATRFTASTRTLAQSLVSAQAHLAQLEAQRVEVASQSESAEQAAAHSSRVLEEVEERGDQLVRESDMTDMRKQTAAMLTGITSKAATNGLPTLKSIEDKLDKESGLAFGQVTLAQESPEFARLEIESASEDIEADKVLASLGIDLAGTPTSVAIQDSPQMPK